MFSAELRFYQRVCVVKNMICNVANDYGFVFSGRYCTSIKEEISISILVQF